MQIIKQRERIEHVEYALVYRWVDMPGAGFGFPCDEVGNLLPMNPAAQENYCMVQGNPALEFKGIERRAWAYNEPAVGLCTCGREVGLAHFTNTCDCGADYNFAGQELAPRSQWGEETSEQLCDILAIDAVSTEKLLDD